MQLTLFSVLLLYLYADWDRIWHTKHDDSTFDNSDSDLEYNLTIIDKFSPLDYWLTTTPGEVAEFEIYTNFLDSFFLRGDPKDYLMFEMLVNDTVKLVFSTCEKRIELLCVETVISSFSIERDECPRTFKPRYILQASSERPVHIRLEITNIPKPMTNKQLLDQFRTDTLASGFSFKNVVRLIHFLEELIDFFGD